MKQINLANQNLCFKCKAVHVWSRCVSLFSKILLIHIKITNLRSHTYVTNLILMPANHYSNDTHDEKSVKFHRTCVPYITGCMASGCGLWYWYKSCTCMQLVRHSLLILQVCSVDTDTQQQDKYVTNIHQPNQSVGCGCVPQAFCGWTTLACNSNKRWWLHEWYMYVYYCYTISSCKSVWHTWEMDCLCSGTITEH